MVDAGVGRAMAEAVSEADQALRGQLTGDDRLAALRAVVARHTAAQRTNPDALSSARAERIVGEALAEVGAGDWSSWSVKDYDAHRYGPLFGVSDDGRNAAVIARAFLDSPKSAVLRRHGGLALETVGACIDAERMSAAGELLVGPPEYGRVYAATAGRIPMSTNVGTVVLPRFYRPPPYVTFRANARTDPIGIAMSETRLALEPYVGSGGSPARPATAFVVFRGDDNVPKRRKVEILRQLASALATGAIGDPRRHSIGLLQRMSDRDAKAARFAIDVAVAAGIRDVRLEGPSSYESQDQLLLPGLLTFFSARVVRSLLAYAQEAGVRLAPKNAIDPETAARTIWAGLTAARAMGAQLGKFGLFPLTLEQQVAVMRLVAELASDWTATPAFYADRPSVSRTRLYEGRGLTTAIGRWLAGAANRFPIILIDAPDRTPLPAGTATRLYQDDRGRRLIKRSEDDKIGILTLADVDKIRARAARVGVRIMWAGGLDGRQVFELAERSEFAIFTTTATARRAPVRGRADPSLASRLVPTHNGVLGVKMVVEAGFLAGRASEAGDRDAASAIEAAAAPIIAALDAGQLANAGPGPILDQLDQLRLILESRWERQLFGPAA